MFSLFTALRFISIIPALVIGVEQIHKGAPGTTKKDAVMSYLALATGAADAVLQGDQKVLADGVLGLFGTVIDGLVKVYHDTGLFVHKAPTA